MKIMGALSKIIVFFLTLVLLAGLAVVVLPWRGFVETQIKNALATQGLKDVQLTLEKIDLHALHLKNVHIGDGFILSNLALAYNPETLLNGQIDKVEVNGLNIRATEKNGAWKIEGLAFNDGQKEMQAPPVPVILEAVHKLPFSHIKINNSTINLAGADWQMTGIIDATFDKQNAKLTAQLRGSDATFGPTKIKTAPIYFDIALDEKKQRWIGNWKSQNLALTNPDLAVPPLKAAGTFSLDSTAFKLDGQLASADNSHTARFAYNFIFEKAASHLNVGAFQLPWNGGVISSQNIAIPLGKKTPIAIKLNVKSIPINKLLQDLTGNKAGGTGIVSGTLPLILMPDGQIKIEQGKMQAESSGIITVQEDALPGDQEQIALLRAIMKNLHYKMLSIEFSKGEKGETVIKLAVEGQNPDIEGGRPVKLNIHLAGDVLKFIQNNLLFITDPKKLLQKVK